MVSFSIIKKMIMLLLTQYWQSDKTRILKRIYVFLFNEKSIVLIGNFVFVFNIGVNNNLNLTLLLVDKRI